MQTTTGATPLLMACDLSNPEQDLAVAIALVRTPRPARCLVVYRESHTNTFSEGVACRWRPGRT